MFNLIATSEPAIEATTHLATDVALPFLLAIVGGGVVSAFLNRLFTNVDRRRDKYAEGVAAATAWCEYPYRIRRRVDDEPATLTALAQLGHDLQERLARSSAWITAEHRKLGEDYSELIAEVKTLTAPLIREAWTSPPSTTSAAMVTDGWGQEVGGTVHRKIAAFRKRTTSRFGARQFLPGRWHRGAK